MNTKILIFKIFALLWLFPLWSNAQQSDEEKIYKVLNDYIEGRNKGDLERLKRAFHPTAALKFVDSKSQDIGVWTIQDYVKRQTPGQKLNCVGQIVNLQIYNDAAQATVLLTYPAIKFHDYMTLLKIQNEWLIVDKVFARKSTPDRILIAVSSHSELGGTGRRQGVNLKEVTHVYAALEAAGYSVDFVSPKGTITHLYGQDLNDPITERFIRNDEAWSKLYRNFTPEEIDPKAYKGIYYAGGHGTVWDFPQNDALAKVAAKIYEDSGVVAAICHGSIGLMNITLSDGSPLIQGKKVTGFTNKEEKETGLDKVVPLLLETELEKKGGLFVAGPNWVSNVQSDQRVVTGQNAQSVEVFAETFVETLNEQKKILKKKTLPLD